MDAKEQAKALVGEAVRVLAEEGAKGSIPGPVIGWLIKKGEIKKPGGKKRRPRGKRADEEKFYAKLASIRQQHAKDKARRANNRSK